MTLKEKLKLYNPLSRTSTKPPVKHAPLVMVESPYNTADLEGALRYLAWCEYDCAQRGELPISSHGNCTAYWPENERFREIGFEWRRRVRQFTDYAVYYRDLGMSPGMLRAYNSDIMCSRKHEVRMLSSELMLKCVRGELPPGSMKRIPQ